MSHAYHRFTEPTLSPDMRRCAVWGCREVARVVMPRPAPAQEHSETSVAAAQKIEGTQRQRTRALVWQNLLRVADEGATDEDIAARYARFHAADPRTFPRQSPSGLRTRRSGAGHAEDGARQDDDVPSVWPALDRVGESMNRRCQSLCFPIQMYPPSMCEKDQGHGKASAAKGLRDWHETTFVVKGRTKAGTCAVRVAWRYGK